MREIKFRAWDGSRMLEMDELCDFTLEELGYQDMEVWEVMQYTGLKDKNGKEIYEGDIIHFKGHFKKGDVGFMGYDEVCFNEHTAQFGYTAWNGGFSPFFGYCTHGTTDSGGIGFCENTKSKDIKVIGNIYENPDLLKPDKEKNL